MLVSEETTVPLGGVVVVVVAPDALAIGTAIDVAAAATSAAAIVAARATVCHLLQF